jgi:hypothetical protein
MVPLEQRTQDEECHDPDDLTAQDDAVHVERRPPGHLGSLDHKRSHRARRLQQATAGSFTGTPTRPRLSVVFLVFAPAVPAVPLVFLAIMVVVVAVFVPAVLAVLVCVGGSVFVVRVVVVRVVVGHVAAPASAATPSEKARRRDHGHVTNGHRVAEHLA